MELAHLTWAEVDSYLKKKTSVIVPVGSTEQHGPTGLIGTDYLNADFIAREVGEKTGTLVTPPLVYGVAQHHMAFSGTISFQAATYIAVIVDIVSSLSTHGFDKFLFINGHGGNIAPITTAMSQYYGQAGSASAAGSEGAVYQLVNWWMPPKTASLIEQTYGADDGVHATTSEISVTQFLFPETVKTAPADLSVAPSGSPSDIHGADHFRAQFPDGRMGSDVRKSNAEDGRAIFETATAEIAGLSEAFFSS